MAETLPTTDRISILIAATLLLAGCGNLNQQQSIDAVKRCASINGVPERNHGINGKYWVDCEVQLP